MRSSWRVRVGALRNIGSETGVSAQPAGCKSSSAAQGSRCCRFASRGPFTWIRTASGEFVAVLLSTCVHISCGVVIRSRSYRCPKIASRVIRFFGEPWFGRMASWRDHLACEEVLSDTRSVLK